MEKWGESLRAHGGDVLNEKKMKESLLLLKDGHPKSPSVGIWADLGPDNSVPPILLLPWSSFGKGWTPASFSPQVEGYP